MAFPDFYNPSQAYTKWNSNYRIYCLSLKKKSVFPSARSEEFWFSPNCLWNAGYFFWTLQRIRGNLFYCILICRLSQIFSFLNSGKIRQHTGAAFFSQEQSDFLIISWKYCSVQDLCFRLPQHFSGNIFSIFIIPPETGSVWQIIVNCTACRPLAIEDECRSDSWSGKLNPLNSQRYSITIEYLIINMIYIMMISLNSFWT